MCHNVHDAFISRSNVAEFINLGIVEFQLRNDANDSEDNNVTLLNGKNFNLRIEASSLDNGALDEVTFWLERGERSVNIESPRIKFPRILSGQTIDLGSTGLDDRLIVSAAEGGLFCGVEEDVFLVVRVNGTKIDPDMTDNEARRRITLNCIEGTYLCLDVDL